MDRLIKLKPISQVDRYTSTKLPNESNKPYKFTYLGVKNTKDD
jgi:hypothetical protein